MSYYMSMGECKQIARPRQVYVADSLTFAVDDLTLLNLQSPRSNDFSNLIGW